jgi:hypothetical protein
VAAFTIEIYPLTCCSVSYEHFYHFPAAFPLEARTAFLGPFRVLAFVRVR